VKTLSNGSGKTINSSKLSINYSQIHFNNYEVLPFSKIMFASILMHDFSLRVEAYNTVEGV
jgi:hypothetical protein